MVTQASFNARPGTPIATRQSTGFAAFWRDFRHNRLAIGGIVVLVVFTLLALFGPQINESILQIDPNAMDGEARLSGPSLSHPFGTDRFGRDIFARIIVGTRVSLGVALLVVAVSMSIGLGVGLVAGVSGGWTDNILMRIVDTLLAVPTLFLILAIAARTQQFQLVGIVVVIGLTGWMGTARLIRGEVLSIKARDYILAARGLGATQWRIIVIYVLPNIVPVLVVAATLQAAAAILIESGLSFLGLGTQPPNATWGSMLNEYQQDIYRAPWMAVFPGLMIMLTVLSFNFIGDGLRDALDPRRRSR